MSRPATDSAAAGMPATPPEPSATERYRLRAAPAPLALVQDLLNTRAIHTYAPDLLADPAAAARWLAGAEARWVPDGLRWRPGPAQPLQPGPSGPPSVGTLTSADLRVLRGLRDTLLSLIGGGRRPGPTTPAATRLVPGADGILRLEPTGTGRQLFVSMLWIAVYQAQQDGTWARLKLCRNDECASAFYDGSRNNSGVWHDVRTCGNVANLRAARQRRRARTAP